MFPEGLEKGRQVYSTNNETESWYFQLTDEQLAEVSKCAHWDCGVGAENCMDCANGIWSPGRVWNKYNPDRQGDGGAWVIPVCEECGDIAEGLRSSEIINQWGGPEKVFWVCEDHKEGNLDNVTYR